MDLLNLSVTRLHFAEEAMLTSEELFKGVFFPLCSRGFEPGGGEFV